MIGISDSSQATISNIQEVTIDTFHVVSVAP